MTARHLAPADLMSLPCDVGSAAMTFTLKGCSACETDRSKSPVPSHDGGNGVMLSSAGSRTLVLARFRCDLATVGTVICGGSGSGTPRDVPFNRRLAVLLAMAMFVLVVDTSLMNVSISAVVCDLDTTVSGVQSAIAPEALVSAAFILIGSKVGDLIGRKRAYVLGLLGYAVGALAMTLAQGLTAIIIFWAVVGGIEPRCCCRPCSR